MNVIDIVLRAKDSTVSAWKSVQSHAAGLGAGLKKALSGGFDIAKKMAVAIGAISAAAAAASIKAVTAYQVQAAAEAKLAATLKATGYAAGLTATDLKNHANELQKLTGTGDETIISMQGILATFRNVKGDQFKDATVAILDMGAAMGKAGKGSADIESSVIQVGKALNDPIQGMSALSRVGVQFTDQQKEQVRALQESGDMAGAQAIILRELQTEFGGTARAVADSQHGILQLKAVFGDTIEEIGRAIVETNQFDDIIERVTEALENLSASGIIDLWAENIRKALERLMPLFSKVGDAFGAIKDKIAMASGFAGAMAGGASIKEAAQIAKDIPAQIEVATQNRLEEIRAEKQARREAKLEEERAAVDAALTKQAAAAPTEVPDAKAAARVAKEQARVAKEQADAQKKLADLDRQEQDVIREGQAEGAAGKRAEHERGIEDARQRIEGLAMNAQERREQRKQQRDIERDESREQELDKRIARGAKLGKDDMAFLEQRRLEKEIADNENNLRELDKAMAKEANERAQRAREDMLAEIKAQRAELTLLLQQG